MSAIAYVFPALSANDRVRVQAIVSDMASFGFAVSPGKLGIWIIHQHGDYLTTIDTVEQLAHFSAGVRAALGRRDDALARVQAIIERAASEGDVSVYVDRLTQALGAPHAGR